MKFPLNFELIGKLSIGWFLLKSTPDVLLYGLDKLVVYSDQCAKRAIELSDESEQHYETILKAEEDLMKTNLLFLKDVKDNKKKLHLEMLSMDQTIEYLERLKADKDKLKKNDEAFNLMIEQAEDMKKKLL